MKLAKHLDGFFFVPTYVFSNSKRARDFHEDLGTATDISPLDGRRVTYVPRFLYTDYGAERFAVSNDPSPGSALYVDLRHFTDKIPADITDGAQNVAHHACVMREGPGRVRWNGETSSPQVRCQTGWSWNDRPQELRPILVEGQIKFFAQRLALGVIYSALDEKRDGRCNAVLVDFRTLDKRPGKNDSLKITLRSRHLDIPLPELLGKLDPVEQALVGRASRELFAS